uniref:Citrate transporter-like domain-containing protein n=1 Tax=Ciona savignyi TaxID=51511 RepID=H2Z9I3_CIOSA
VPRFLRQIWAFQRTLCVILPPLLLLPIPIVIGGTEAACGYAILIMAIYWVTEAIPLAVTAFLPLIMFPMSGIMSASAVSKAYFSDTAWLFVGGLIIAVSVEVTNLHKRIALSVLVLVGAKPRWLMLGFMLTTYFLSMWISNTATTAMMLPIVEAILEMTRARSGKGDKSAEDESKTSMSTSFYNDVFETDKDMNLQTICKEFIQNFTVFKEKLKDSQTMEIDSEDVDIFVPEHIESEEERNKRMDNLIKGITLCVPYAASIGGTATVTGTGPNLVLSGLFNTLFPDATIKLSFANWIAYALPGSLCMLVLSYIWLSIFFLGFSLRDISSCLTRSNFTEGEKNARKVIVTEYKKLGNIKWKEVTVLAVFTTTALLWFFRDPGFMPGWSVVFKEDFVDDGTVAMTMAFFLFFLPSERPSFLKRRQVGNEEKNEDDLKRPVSPILDWPTVHRMFPWSVMFLITGGFALAEGATQSGFSQWLGDQLIFLGDLPTWVISLIVTIIVCLFTECSSNVATASLFVPILANLAQSLRIHPLHLMIPPVLACSLAFMLPVATPPNALAFSYGHIKVLDLVKAGSMLNIMGVAIITLFINTYGYSLFGLGEFPSWAELPGAT